MHYKDIKFIKNIIHEILYDEDKTKLFAEKIKNDLKRKKLNIFIKNFNSIIIKNEILKINNNYYHIELINILGRMDKLNSDERMNYLLEDNDFELKMQLLLYEIDKMTEEEKIKILNIFYDIIGNMLPHY